MILGAIVLIGVALLNQAANCQASKYDTLEEFAKSPDNQGLDIDQVRQLLLRGKSGDIIGQATVGELLKLDAIQVEHCNMVGLDICKKVNDDKDLARFCQNRLDELAKFCAGRLDQVIDAELRKFRGKGMKLFDDDIVEATRRMDEIPIDNIRRAFKQYLGQGRVYIDRYCHTFFEHVKLIEAILERSGERFDDLALHNKSIFNLFIVYEICQASKEMRPGSYESS